MENKKYLTEENYQSSNKKVKTIGTVLIVIGLVLFIVGLILIFFGFLGFGNEITNGMEMGQKGINVGNVFSSFGGFAIGGFMIVPGLFLATLGIVFRFLIGNRREIVAYTTQQVMPVAKEGIEEMAPTIGNAMGEIAKGIKKGLKDEE